MQDSLLRLTQEDRSVIQYETEFTALARYAPQFVSTPEDRCHQFFHGLRDELKYPLVPLRLHDFSELVERARLIEMVLPTSPVTSDVGRKRFAGESSRSGSILALTTNPETSWQWV